MEVQKRVTKINIYDCCRAVKVPILSGNKGTMTSTQPFKAIMARSLKLIIEYMRWSRPMPYPGAKGKSIQYSPTYV